MISQTKLNNTFAFDQFTLESCSIRPVILIKKRPETRTTNRELKLNQNIVFGQILKRVLDKELRMFNIQYISL